MHVYPLYYILVLNAIFDIQTLDFKKKAIEIRKMAMKKSEGRQLFVTSKKKKPRDRSSQPER